MKWLKAVALPLWADVGVDPAGGFYEQIDQQGRPVTELPRRARVVARQTYVFATATERGWGAYMPLVDHGAAALFDHCLRADGMALSTYAPGGAPLKETFDSYDQAFVLFALATIARTRSDLRERAVAAGERLLASMQAHFSHPNIGFEEAMPPRTPLLQNPHMHLLEACIQFDSVPEVGPSWRTQAASLVELARSKLSDRKTGAIHEYFDAAWEPIVDTGGGAIEPGHQFEWAWLLWQWHDRVGDSDAAALAARLHAIGTDHGRAPDGQVIDLLDVTLSPRERTLRLWPQTERLKACLAAVEQTEVQGVQGLCGAEEALRSLEPYFATSVPGLWYDRLDENNEAIKSPAPASSLYHIVCALDYTERFAQNSKLI
ncbi:AGE family epimerase/isomerase [Sphingomonas yabuuchiae]|uniref:AGE family epimerase/isomerase n=1 Tax=Sphingomonas yabuuchiae TaxID=172044 RepID=UPI003D9836B2